MLSTILGFVPWSCCGYGAPSKPGGKPTCVRQQPTSLRPHLPDWPECFPGDLNFDLDDLSSKLHFNTSLHSITHRRLQPSSPIFHNRLGFKSTKWKSVLRSPPAMDLNENNKGISARKRKAASPSPNRDASVTAPRSIEMTRNDRKRRIAGDTGRTISSSHTVFVLTR